MTESLTVGLYVNAAVVGEECHIVAESPGSARFVEGFAD